MKFEEALSKLDGADSVGGDLIVVHEGKHVLVGKNVQGTLIVADSKEAKAIAASIGIEIEVEATIHEITIEDGVNVADDPAPAPKTSKR